MVALQIDSTISCFALLIPVRNRDCCCSSQRVTSLLHVGHAMDSRPSSAREFSNGNLREVLGEKVTVHFSNPQMQPIRRSFFQANIRDGALSAVRDTALSWDKVLEVGTI